jgi:hypothetical protein
MDELLLDRVKQLKEIDDRLERMKYIMRTDALRKAIVDLRNELGLMIQRAEEEYANF